MSVKFVTIEVRLEFDDYDSKCCGEGCPFLYEEKDGSMEPCCKHFRSELFYNKFDNNRLERCAECLEEFGE